MNFTKTSFELGWPNFVHGGVVHLLLVPSHNSISEILAPEIDAKFERLPDPTRLIWRLEVPENAGAVTRIEVLSVGNPPRLLLEEPIIWHDGDNLVMSEFVNADPVRVYDDNLGETLVDRAEVVDRLRTKEHTFFAQYDAWINPTIRDWLSCEGRHLRGRAGEIFGVTGLPPPGTYHPTVSIGELSRRLCEMLATVPYRRGVELYRNKLVRRTLPLSHAQADWLARNHLTFERLISIFSSYQFAIFDILYPRNELGRQDLEDALMLFSVGELRPDVLGQAIIYDDRINFEPDGAQFFVFAEYFCQAALVAASKSEHDECYRLGSLFAAMQPLYCEAYGDRAGSLETRAYGPQFFRRLADASLGRLRGDVRTFRHYFPDPDAVIRRTADHALTHFRKEIERTYKDQDASS